MEKIGSYSSLLNPRVLRGLLSFAIKGYLVEKGWIKSYKLKQAVDFNGQPIPWLTYSFLDFIEGRLSKDLTLFEYGSGNSTLFFADKLKEIQSVEYDKEWLDLIVKQVSENVKLIYTGLDSGSDYENAIITTKVKYDIVLIDGRRRVACLKNSIQSLTPSGVLILDDSEREKYKEAFVFMKEHGFKHIPFSGIAIGSIHSKCTTVFYRKNNVFNI